MTTTPHRTEPRRSPAHRKSTRERALGPEERERELLRRQVQRLSARQSFYEVIGDKILAAIGKLPALPRLAVRPPERHKRGEEDMVLLLSDVRAGLKIDAKESGGLASYNAAVLVEQLAHLERSIHAIRGEHRHASVLHTMFLGDIVEGRALDGGALGDVDQGVVDQALFVIEHFARFLRAFAGEFTTVHCYGVIGNQGRIARGDDGPMSNLDYLVYRVLKERLAPVRNVHWRVAESWWQLATVQGWRFLLVHGDDRASGNCGGLPFHAVSRKVRYRELLRTARWLRAREAADFDFMVSSHLLQPAEFENVIMNGSWPGGTELSLRREQLSSIPTQKLFGVHRHHGITWVRNVHLRPVKAS